MGGKQQTDDWAVSEPDSIIDPRGTAGMAGVQLMSLNDVAKQLDVSLSTLRRRIAEGVLRVHRIGRAIRVSHADLGAFLAASRSEKP